MGTLTVNATNGQTVAAGASYTVPYPAGKSAGSYMTAGAKITTSDGSIYSATVSLGASSITITNPTGRSIASGGFDFLDLTSSVVDVTAKLNSIGRVKEYLLGSEVVKAHDFAVGKNYSNFNFPLNQSGLATVLPTDYSGNDVAVTYGSHVGVSTQPWANAGYFTSHYDGGSKATYAEIPNSAINCNFYTDSFIFGATINKATPAGTETILGSSTGSDVGMNININATGKVGPRIFVNGAFVATTYGTATAANAADHRVLIAWDAPAKTLSLYVDGALDITQVAGTVLSTDIQAGVMRLGEGTITVQNSVDCKFAGLEFLVFEDSGLPINMVDLAVADNAHRRTGLIGEPIFL